ncbi:sensor histidine kinase [Lederbergia galactosidilytica]|uniref:HAMP domain-containing protein n=1 Tax=Lederbergia galactosidilytica TaxID=217031 RepID=A0A177ZVB8_9BACI|nr:sensor histidine kinase [Lederbergia galactosidilytica]KRG15303.1 hypothetical protein ACA30_06640 [Virgibacillus soli]MBP1915983.1 two-component system sensor histidine kinase YesM [Lederbergia galactosidilytica]OAK71270.1 hypothetical protein ABB05_11025 [Lederbergia galactosidilytica]
MKNFHFNDISLRNKLLLVYFISVFIPIVATNIIFYYVTNENVKTQKIQDLSLTLEQMADEFRQGIDDAIGISTVLYTDNNLYTFLETRYESVTEFIRAYNADFRDIDKYVPIYSSIHSISVYTDNETVIFAGGVNPIDEQVKESYWYQNTNNLRKSYPVLTRTKGKSDKLDTFSVIRELDHYHHNSTQKILKIELGKELLTQTFNNITFPGDIYLVNEENVIEYTTDSSIPWGDRDYQFDSIVLPDNTVVLEKQYDLQYINQWKVIGVASENALVDEVRNSRNFIFYLALVNFVLPSLVIIYISSSIHRRLSRIVKHMRKVEDQNFAMIEGLDYRDEIGELTSAFNRMSQKIKELINDVFIVRIQKKDLELQRKQAQLSALQSQINPHFLFNVLETIRMRSILKNEDETANIIKNMAQLLRTSITWGKDMVTVKEEVDLIRSFLEIQEYRFDDKMQYLISVEEETYYYSIPNMSLIPFVENASIHGIEALKGKGKIEINIQRIDGKLQCTMKDTGTGMGEEQLDQILRSLEAGEVVGESIGIKNVYHRLKMHYGEQFQFQMESLPGEGTTVKILIPIQK